MIRSILSKLRARGIDVQSAHRRDAMNPMTVQRRIMRGRDVRVIFDCGAHHGFLTREYRRTFPDATVHCFEPTPETFRILERNLKGEANVVLVPAAVGAESGETIFYLGSDEQNNSFAADQQGRDGIRVRVVSMGDYCREKNIDRIDILKIDIEGFELQALRGVEQMLREQRIGLLLLEVRFEPVGQGCTHFIELAEFLRERGYRFYGLYNSIYFPNLRFDWGDAIFVSDADLAAMR